MALLCATLISCKKAEPKPGPAAIPRTESAWPVYENAYFKLSYPPNFKVSNPNKDIWAFGEDMSADAPINGQVIISPELGPKGMLLRDAVEADAEQAEKRHNPVIGGIRSIRVTKGTCLGILTRSDGLYQVVCDGPAGHRYQVSFFLPAPLGTPKATQAADLFERILASIEFKQ